VTDTIQSIIGVGQERLILAFFVFLRVGAAMALLPVVGERAVPNRIRLVLALVFTVIVAPAVVDGFAFTHDQPGRLVLALFGEVAIGLGIGFSLRLFMFALQVAGSIAAQSTSLSQIFGGAGVDPQPAIGHLLVIGGLALAVTYGLHVQIAGFLIYSYQIFEPGQIVPAADFSSWGLARIAKAFAMAFTLAAPFVVASLIYNIALGAINRAMPQLMVSFVGAPAITAGGLVLLFVAAPLMLSAWHSALDGFLQNPYGNVP